MVRIERGSGKRAFGAWPGKDPKSAIIWEAFKAESEPRRTIHRDDLPKVKQEKKQEKTTSKGNSGPSQPRDSDFLQKEGGIY